MLSLFRSGSHKAHHPSSHDDHVPTETEIKQKVAEIHDLADRLDNVRLESAKTKLELARVNQELAKTKQESAQTKQKSVQTKQESAQTKQESASHASKATEALTRANEADKEIEKAYDSKARIQALKEQALLKKMAKEQNGAPQSQPTKRRGT
jgi:chromosome segregation ATPase